MHAAGRSLEEIGDFVGHTSPYMTDRYRHLIEGQRQDAAGAFDAYIVRAGEQRALMDPETKEILSTSTAAVAQGTAKAGIEAFGGPFVDLMELVRGPIRERVFRAQLARYERGLKLLEEKGIPRQDVDLKFLAPWLQGAGLDHADDEKMTERWAALLANAAAGEGLGAGVLPSFPSMLAELSPQEAVILDAIYLPWGPPVAEEVSTIPGLAMETLRTNLGMTDDPLFEARLSNLDRLSSCLVSESQPRSRSDAIRLGWVRSTALGQRFVAACTPPTAGTGAHTGAHPA